MLPVLVAMGVGLLCNSLLSCPPPHNTIRADAAGIIYAFGCAILYCATLPTPLFGNPLLYYPPTLHLYLMLPGLVR